jgi:hypothetical protein
VKVLVPGVNPVKIIAVAMENVYVAVVIVTSPLPPPFAPALSLAATVDAPLTATLI